MKNNEKPLSQQGKLITISGIAGAGKSTFIRNAIEIYSDKLEYLKSYTTRPRRKGENDSEYHFVSNQKFTEALNQSDCWNGGDIYGNHYGEDVSYYLRRLKTGRFLINCCFPSVEELSSLYKFYSKEQVYSIYFDVPKMIAADRLLVRDGESALSRIAINNTLNISSEFLSEVDCVFRPTNDLETNTSLFNNLVNDIIVNFCTN